MVQLLDNKIHLRSYLLLFFWDRRGELLILRFDHIFQYLSPSIKASFHIIIYCDISAKKEFICKMAVSDVTLYFCIPFINTDTVEAS